MLLFWREFNDFIHSSSVISSYHDIFPYIKKVFKKYLMLKKNDTENYENVTLYM